MKFAVLFIPFLFQSTSAKCGDSLLTNIEPDEINSMQHFKVNEWGNFDTQQVVKSMLMGDGNRYDQFVVIHPPAYEQHGTTVGYVQYNNLNGNYDSFTGLIGLAADSHCTDNYATTGDYDGFVLKIYVDSILKYTSNKITTIFDYEYINVDTKNGKVLKLEVDSGRKAWCDHAIIANPLLNYRNIPLPPPQEHEPGSCAAAKWFEIGYLTDINEIWNGNTPYNLYNYAFGVDYNSLIQEVVINGWNKGLRVSSLNDYPMGDNSDSLKLGRTVFTYGLDDNPTNNNWYHYYYFNHNDNLYYSNKNQDCVPLYARRINEWKQVGVLSDIGLSSQHLEPISGYSMNDYEYGIDYNSIIHRVMINSWNRGLRVSTIDSYPMGDNSNSLQFGKTVFTKGLEGNENQNEWYHMYWFVNKDGDQYYYSNGIQSYVEVFVKSRESMCV